MRNRPKISRSKMPYQDQDATHGIVVHKNASPFGRAEPSSKNFQVEQETGH